MQEIETVKGKRWLLLDDNYEVIIPVKDYLKYLDNLGRSPNTIKNYALHLKTFFEYLKIIDIEYNEIASQQKKAP